MTTPARFCTTPEHQPSYVVARVGRVVCPLCNADVPSPHPAGPQHVKIDVIEDVSFSEQIGRRAPTSRT